MDLLQAYNLARTAGNANVVLPKQVDPSLASSQVAQAISNASAPSGQSVSLSGNSQTFINADLGMNAKTKNRFIQFNISNTGEARPLRFGSIASQPYAYQMLGIPAGAVDAGTGVSDQRGLSCYYTQAWSQIVNLRPVVIKSWQVIVPSGGLNQLYSPLQYNAIALDLTIDQSTVNYVNTERRSDNNATTFFTEGMWLLEPMKYFEYMIQAGSPAPGGANTVTIIMEVALLDSTRGMVTY